jgi:signal transduction histidine kinase
MTVIRWRQLRSAGMRFAVVYALLLAFSALSIAWFLWWSTAGLLNRQIEATIQADAENLSEHWRDGGVPALVLRIDERLAQNIEDDSLYLLVDPRGRLIAGNLERWPPHVDEAGPYFEIPVQRGAVRSLSRVQRFDLPGGFRLLIGREVAVRAQLRTLLTDALLWTLVIVAAVAMLGGLIVRNLFQGSIANVSATAAAIAAGDLTRRVKLSGRGDELDQLSEVINEMLDRIGRLMDGVRQVSNAIAHDLRTPITRARTRLEDAALHAETPEDLRAAIERATSDLDGVVAIFQALLRISEIEAGSRRASFAPLDAAPLLHDVAELYDVVAEERGVALVLDSAGRLPMSGDAALVRQAVANLVDNALKFSPPGSTVRILGRVRPNGVEIVVSDQGPGIPEADRERAVERFYRGEAARNTPGSGLGLTLVGAVAQLHGGTLRLEDAGPGLKASLLFPTADGSAS